MALISNKNEHQELIELIKKSQTDYLVKGSFDKRYFEFAFKEEKTRLAEVEEQQELLKEKLKRETKRYIILKYFGLIVSKINEFFESKQRKKKWKDLKKKSHG